jgi:DNA invertase Pin-like site-specific DNA recombinase
MKPTITDNQTIKEILAGKYRDCFLVYARKSTDEPNNQKNSLKYQRAENIKFSQREKLTVAQIALTSFCVDGIISERHSGFKEDSEVSITSTGLVQYGVERPKFLRLIQFLSKGFFKGVIVLCWDRISRNRGDDTVLRKLMKNGVKIRFVYANYENTSAGALHMDIDSMFSEHHSRVTSEKVTLITRSLREGGICTYKAPIGYLNEGTMKHKPLDPERSPIIRKIFQILAKKEWSLSDLADWANRQGLTSPPARRPRTAEELLAEEDDDVTIQPVSRPMTVTMVHKILTNPFYTGKILTHDGRYVQSKSHEALITESLFVQVQAVLKRKRVSVHYADKLDLPGRGLIRCADCTRLYTPYVKKGIQYFSARCRPGCPNLRKNFNVTFFEKKVSESLRHLSLTEAEIAELETRDRMDNPDPEVERLNSLDANDRRQRKLREDLAYLHDNKLSLLKAGTYSPDGFVQEEIKLAVEIKRLGSSEPLGASTHEVLSDIIKLSELIKNGSAYHSFANFREKQEFLTLIFSELFISGNTLTYQCRNGFKALESRFIPVCDHTGWLSEALQNNNLLKESIEGLKHILGPTRAMGP